MIVLVTLFQSDKKWKENFFVGWFFQENTQKKFTVFPFFMLCIFPRPSIFRLKIFFSPQSFLPPQRPLSNIEVEFIDPLLFYCLRCCVFVCVCICLNVFSSSKRVETLRLGRGKCEENCSCFEKWWAIYRQQLLEKS